MAVGHRFISSQGHTFFFFSKTAHFPSLHKEIVSISIMEVFVICFPQVGLSFAIKMKWATQTKLIIIAGVLCA